jgi:hypothetical protein
VADHLFELSLYEADIAGAGRMFDLPDPLTVDVACRLLGELVGGFAWNGKTGRFGGDPERIRNLLQALLAASRWPVGSRWMKMIERAVH